MDIKRHDSKVKELAFIECLSCSSTVRCTLNSLCYLFIKLILCILLLHRRKLRLRNITELAGTHGATCTIHCEIGKGSLSIEHDSTHRENNKFAVIQCNLLIPTLCSYALRIFFSFYKNKNRNVIV